MDQLHPDPALLPFLRKIALLGFNYHLFTNLVTTGLDAVLGDFTEETGLGYGPISVTGAAFTLSSVAGHVGQITAPDISFNPGAATTWTDYGYYVTDTGNTMLFAFALFDGGPLVTPNPAGVVVTPKLGIQSTFSV